MPVIRSIPAKTLQRLHLLDWPPGSLLIEIDPKSERPRGFAMAVRVLNDHGTAIDRPALLCLTPWSSMDLVSGDILPADDLPVLGVKAAEFVAWTEADPTRLKIHDTVNDSARPALLANGELIIGMYNRSSTSRQHIGFGPTSLACAPPTLALNISGWKLCLAFSNARDPTDRFEIEVG